MEMMMKQLYLSVVVDLPDCAFTASDVYAQIKGPWLALGDGLHTAGVTFTSKVEEMQVRAKATRKPRKPRLVTPPQDAA
jgi:hypothetical protein